MQLLRKALFLENVVMDDNGTVDFADTQLPKTHELVILFII